MTVAFGIECRCRVHPNCEEAIDADTERNAEREAEHRMWLYADGVWICPACGDDGHISYHLGD